MLLNVNPSVLRDTVYCFFCLFVFFWGGGVIFGFCFKFVFVADVVFDRGLTM